MAADVGVKLNVSGVSQFKSAMNTAKSSVKQLDAELKLNAAQYKATGDAEEYMAGRSRILAQQIKAQEDVVANCQKALETMASQGVDKASASYTNMAAQLAKAKTDLLQMQQGAEDAGESLEKVAEGGDKAGKSLKSIETGVKWQNLTAAFDKIESKIRSIWNHAVNVGKAIAGWERGASDWADTLITDAAMYGLDVETLQRWQYAAQLIDTDVDTIVKAQDKLMSKTGSTDGIFATITSGNSQYAVRVRESNGALRDQADVLWDFLDVLKQVDSETDRNALAQEYFGKSYRELIPLMNAGREGWEKAAESATIVDEEYVTALGQLNDAYVTFDGKLQALSETLAGSFAPAMEELLGVLGVVSDDFMAWLQSDEGKAAIERLGNAVVGLVSGLADIKWDEVFQGATDTINSISELLEGLDSDDIISGLKVVGGIIGGWTISKDLMEFYLFAKSFKGFGGGNGGGAAGGAAGAGAGAGASAGASGGSWIGNAWNTIKGAGSAIAGSMGGTMLATTALTAAVFAPLALLLKGDQYSEQLRAIEGVERLYQKTDYDSFQQLLSDYEGMEVPGGGRYTFTPENGGKGGLIEYLSEFGEYSMEYTADLEARIAELEGEMDAAKQRRENQERPTDDNYITVGESENGRILSWYDEAADEYKSFYEELKDGTDEIVEAIEIDPAEVEARRKAARMAKNYADLLLEDTSEGEAYRKRMEQQAINDIFASFYEEQAEEARAAKEAALREAANNWRAGSVAKNYADLLMETPIGGEMDADGWRNYTTYMVARQMAENLHNGEIISSDKAEDDSESIADWANRNMDLITRIWENLYPEDFASDLNFSAQLMEVATQAGEQTSGAFTDGAMANVEAAFAAGAALAGAFASGLGSINPGGGGDTNYNSSYVGAVNVYGAQSPREIADAYQSYIITKQMGYGG